MIKDTLSTHTLLRTESTQKELDVSNALLSLVSQKKLGKQKSPLLFCYWCCFKTLLATFNSLIKLITAYLCAL